MTEALFTPREMAPVITRRLLDRVTEMLHGLPGIRAAELTANMLIQIGLNCDDADAADAMIDELAQIAKAAARENFQRRGGTAAN